MGTGSLTGYFDVAQVTLYVFWIFFAGLVYYLHRENKREGYPLENERSGRIDVQGFPAVPPKKTYTMPDGTKHTVGWFSRHDSPGLANLKPTAKWLGSPYEPVGDPMTAGVGPGSWCARADVPERTWEGGDRIVPLRVATDYKVDHRDPDPRGMPVVGCDGKVGGRVRDVWVDRSEAIIRYLEIDVPNAAHGPEVLLPMNFARISDGRVLVKSVRGDQIGGAPRLKHPDRVTRLEEEKIGSYYGAGTLYALPSRREPLF